MSWKMERSASTIQQKIYGLRTELKKLTWVIKKGVRTSSSPRRRAFLCAKSKLGTTLGIGGIFPF
jgi:hypothetical protein